MVEYIDRFDALITQALQEWLGRHPDPDTPFLSIASQSQCFTPRELVHEVAERTEMGQTQLRVFRHYAVMTGDIDGQQLLRAFELAGRTG